MNEADTVRMHALLGDEGMLACKCPEEADVILVNGCTVRDKARHKAISAIGGYAALRRDRGAMRPVIGLGGCVGQLEKDAVFKRIPELDFVFGTDTIDQLPLLVKNALAGLRRQVMTDFDADPAYSTMTRISGVPGVRAYVNIMKGCNKHCSFCIVPQTRGPEKSRSMDEIIGDVASLVSRGVREVTLLGQNVNSYGRPGKNENFPGLLRAIDADPRCLLLKRIRFTSSHPWDFSEELIGCYAPPARGGVSRLAWHLHLPVQSGSDRILSLMGRDHEISDYVRKMDLLRGINPEVGVSTDLIVGFPGETEQDFRATEALLDRVGFDSIFAFAYSQRPGTRAAGMNDDVPQSGKLRRLGLLLARQEAISSQRYATRIGREMEILVEGCAKNSGLAAARGLRAAVWSGRTTCNRVVNFMSGAGTEDLKDRFVLVSITGATGLSLQGEMIRVTS